MRPVTRVSPSLPSNGTSCGVAAHLPGIAPANTSCASRNLNRISARQSIAACRVIHQRRYHGRRWFVARTRSALILRAGCLPSSYDWSSGGSAVNNKRGRFCDSTTSATRNEEKMPKRTGIITWVSGLKVYIFHSSSSSKHNENFNS